MNAHMSRIACLLALGFVAGFGVAMIAGARASSHALPDAQEHRHVGVTVLEVKQTLAGTSFRGGYRGTVTLSDGKPHLIELRQVRNQHRPGVWVEFKDNGRTVTNIGAGGWSMTDEGLMVMVDDLDALKAQFEQPSK